MFYIFNNIRNKEILLKAKNLNNDNDKNELKSMLFNLALEEGFNGNIWQSYVLYTLIFNENPFTRAYERKKINQMFSLVSLDLLQYEKLYYTKVINDDEIYDFSLDITPSYVSLLIAKIKKDIEELSFKEAILKFYYEYGVGDLAIYKAFRVENGTLYPIKNVREITFSDLIGYEKQKELLKENTLNFINGKTYNNVLLYGDSGTGKSSSIQAILNEYYSYGLRIIEVYKHQMQEISKVIASLKQRPYKFIIYMDDLSFEDDEIEYKYLKSIIEGGIEPKPYNVVIYATSNRRHLIKESFLDNQSDDLHRNETQAEKLSLAYRFGLQIYYSSLSVKEFRNMVLELASKNDINIDEDILLKEASAWEMTYGTLSGRCATQFISYLKNKFE